MTVTHLVGQVLDRVADIPDASIDLVATSPPFLALRNYNNLDGQWGSEATPAAFLDNLLDLVEALGPKLAGHGSIAFELGDTYSGSGGSGWHRSGNEAVERYRSLGTQHDHTKNGAGWPLAKSLTGVPTLFAWSLAYGRNLLNPERTIEPWRIRNVIVWARANPPVGALGDKFRPATSYITVATRSDKRWFDLDAVRVEPKPHTLRYPRSAEHYASQDTGSRHDDGVPMANDGNPAGAPPLDHCNDTENLTWHINTHGSALAHYAMWPPTLAERLILSMCPAEVCTVCGEPRRRITGPPEYKALRQPFRDDMRPGIGWQGNDRQGMSVDKVPSSRTAPTLGWSDCGHNNNWRPGHVLDPFAGTGTTLAVADIHGRDATGIDLDPTNRGLYERRYEECWRALKGGTSPVTEHGEQLGLL